MITFEVFWMPKTHLKDVLCISNTTQTSLGITGAISGKTEKSIFHVFFLKFLGSGFPNFDGFLSKWCSGGPKKPKFSKSVLGCVIGWVELRLYRIWRSA